MDDPSTSDLELLKRFARQGDERAFETLVRRYANLVFGVALRRGVGREGAEDVTQKVFAVLARKAKRLRRRKSLAGWLSRTASLEAIYLRRTESNRQRKMDNYSNSAAAPMGEAPLDGTDDALWRAAMPHLDEVMAELSQSDQEVVLQRFYNEQSFASIASLVGKSESAVQKQSQRAIVKMSKLLKRRGVVVPAVGLASLLGAELGKAAPDSALETLTQGAIATAPQVAGSEIITNTLETMAYAKTKTALVVAAVAAIPTGMQWSKINELQDQLEQQAVPAVAPPVAGSDIAALESEIADLKNQLAAAIQPKGQDVVTALKGRGGEGGASNPAAEGLAGLADMFDDPSMRELMRSQLKASVDMLFGEFLEHSGLDGEQRTRFEDLLLDRQMAMASLGMKGMKKGISDEERSAIQAQLDEAKVASNEKIREMLGEELFDEFELYENSSNERMELNAFKEGLAREGVPELSREQEEQLMAVMYEERTAFEYSGGFDPSGSDIPQWDGSTENIERIIGDHARLQGQIAARVGEFLNPEQLAAFQSNQDSFHKMMEASLKMSMSMFGGGESGERTE